MVVPDEVVSLGRSTSLPTKSKSYMISSRPNTAKFPQGMGISQAKNLEHGRLPPGVDTMLATTLQKALCALLTGIGSTGSQNVRPLLLFPLKCILGKSVLIEDAQDLPELLSFSRQWHYHIQSHPRPGSFDGLPLKASPLEDKELQDFIQVSSQLATELLL